MFTEPRPIKRGIRKENISVDSSAYKNSVPFMIFILL